MLTSKRLIVAVLLIAGLALPLTGCWNRREIETLAIVAGVGIDLGEEPGTYIITAQVVKPQEIGSSSASSMGGIGQQQGGAGQAVWVLEGTGHSIFEAIRNLVSESTRKLYFPHSQVIIIGKAAAEQGVGPLIEVFVRDPEPRTSAYVLIAEGKASEILDTAIELASVPALGLAQIVEAQRAQSVSPIVSLLQLSNRLLSKSTAPIATAVRLRESRGQQRIHVEGTAVFVGDKLVGGLDREETRGLLWVTGEIGSGSLLVDCPDSSEMVTLEIIRSKTEIRPVANNGSVSMEITVNMTANLGSNMCMQPLSEPELIAELEKLGSEAITAEITAVINKAKEMWADVFGFGELIHQEMPGLWRDLEPKWQDAFAALDVDIKVNTKVRRVSLTTRPLVPDR